MNYEEFKKNYQGTAKNIMNYGDSIRVFHLIIGIIINAPRVRGIF